MNIANLVRTLGKGAGIVRGSGGTLGTAAGIVEALAGVAADLIDMGIDPVATLVRAKETGEARKAAARRIEAQLQAKYGSEATSVYGE